MVGAPLFDELGYAAELQHVSDRVHWLGHPDDIPALMQAVDVVIHTSTMAEPFGRVIAEGMVAARPFLAAGAGASRELLGGDDLVVVPPGDPSLLAASLRRILDLPKADRIALGRRNRERAESLFSISAMLTGISCAIGQDAATP